MKKIISDIYTPDTIEFVTAAAEFCAFVETAESIKQKDFVESLRRLLPLVYLKQSLLNVDLDNDNQLGFNEELVTEQDYNAVRNIVARILSDKDDYLDVFLEDMKYSETPILHTISEDIADIYQDLRNFCGTYREGHEESMRIALIEVCDNFKQHWGQTLVNALRPLHEIAFNNEDSEDF